MEDRVASITRVNHHFVVPVISTIKYAWVASLSPAERVHTYPDYLFIELHLVYCI